MEALHASPMLLALKYQIGLMEKQIRMLAEMSEGTPSVHRGETVGDRREGSDFIAVHRDVIEQLKREIGVIQNCVRAALGEIDSVGEIALQPLM